MDEEKKDNGLIEISPYVDAKFDWNNREHTLSFIRSVCKRVDKRRNATKAKQFQSILKQSRDVVLERALALANGSSNCTSQDVMPLLPCHTEKLMDGRGKHNVKLLNPKAKKWSTNQITKPVPLESLTKERPTAKSTVFLKSNHAAEDQKSLTFAPYFGDDDENNEVLQELFDTSKREELLDSGPEHMEEERNTFIDEVLEAALKALEEKIDALPSTRFLADLINVERIMFRVQDHIADVKCFDIAQIRQRYTLNIEPRVNVMYGHEPKTKIAKAASVESSVKNSEIDTCKPVEYGDVMDSYRHLFCRLCMVYDCNRHGVLPRSNNTLPLETTLAIQKEDEGAWKNGETSSKKHELHEHETNNFLNYPRKLTTLQRAVIKHAYQAYKGDVSKISRLLKANPGALKEFAAENNITSEDHKQLYCQFIGTSERKPKRKKRKQDGSMNNFDQTWLKRVETAEIHPAYEPCDHIEPCSEDTCSCVKNAFFCTKYCVWGNKSKYFFPGCRCKRGECRLKSCPCFAAGKECDPDLCHNCGACTDHPNRPAVKQKCRNDNIGMRRHCQLLVAESQVKGAGWGVYNKTALKRGDFIHEYLGEVITQEEADRRGCIYDKVNRSFLFNLTSDTVVDASRKGNKARFLNHCSKDPNCYTKILKVGGDARIGIFAKEDINPQTELFFDYRYDVSMNNELIEKPAMHVQWMHGEKMKKSRAHKKSSSHGELKNDLK